MALKSVERRVDELELNKQDTLVSGVTIKTINGNSVLGSGNLTVGGSVAWGSITGTLSDQTDLQTALNAKQNTLVSGTNIKTINGNTLLGSGDLTISTGITVGTTPVTSGTDGRVFFQSGGVVQQDSSLFWDNNNKRLGIGATPSTNVRLDVRAQGILSTDVALRIRNITNTASFFSVLGNGNVGVGTESPNYRLTVAGDNYNFRIANSTNSTGYNVGRDQSDGILYFYGEQSGFNGYAFTGVNGERMRIATSGNVGIGTTSPQARLDVRAQGALSTDIAFRVRNSADSADLFSVRGDNLTFVNNKLQVGSYLNGNTKVSISGTDNIISYFGGGNASSRVIYAEYSASSTNNSAVGEFFNRVGIVSASGNFHNAIIARLDSGNANITARGINCSVTTAGTNIGGRFSASGGVNNYAIIAESGNVGIGQIAPTARLDVRAQGALSTDIAFRVRNSANTTDIGSIRGNGIWCIGLLASAPTGVEGAIYYDSTTKKHYGFDGTNWNALY